jgi:uncharacterized protein YmfQ (DUF2313 family)
MRQDARPADWLAALRALLPRGAVWAGAYNGVLGGVLNGIADRLGWIEGRIGAVLNRESLPVAAVDLLPEWERVFALPDLCCPAPEAQAVAQRQAVLRSRLTDSGGQSRAHFIALAAQYGYTISIQEYAPARAGLMRAGDRCRSMPWRFAWGVTGYTPVPFPARAGAFRAGQRLRVWDAGMLPCVLNRVKPAHTLLFFAAADGASALTADAGGLLTDDGAAALFP